MRPLHLRRRPSAGLSARVIEDCVIGSTVERHLAALDAMEYLRFGARRRTEDVLAVLGARALTPTGFGGIS